jgi:hypothetical protein
VLDNSELLPQEIIIHSVMPEKEANTRKRFSGLSLSTSSALSQSCEIHVPDQKRAVCIATSERVEVATRAPLRCQSITSCVSCWQVLLGVLLTRLSTIRDADALAP